MSKRFLCRIAASAWVSVSGAGELAIGAIHLATPDPAVGRMCEISVPLAAEYDDPFDPAEISLVATIVTSDRRVEVPGFWFVDHDRRMKDDGDAVLPGEAGWRVRFLPESAGEHEIIVAARDRSGRTTSDPLVVTVAPRDWRGLVRVSEAQPLSLQWDSGELFYPMGINIFDKTDLGRPLAADRVDEAIRYIRRLASAGGNFIRLRMDAWWFAIENPPDPVSGYAGPAKFHPRAAWDIDRIFHACEEAGIQVMLCTQNANADVNKPSEAWRRKYNVYARENGGPCRDMAEFWTDPAARELVRRRIRYCVARWGASPALAMWEFFNEVILTPENGGAVTAWHDEMSREFKRLDPHRRIVTTSPMGEHDPEANARLWGLPHLDVAQVHEYGHLDTGSIGATAGHGAAAYGKPFIVGEFGVSGRYVRDKRFKYSVDRQGMSGHLGRWAAAMTPGSGALDWFVRESIDAHDVWDDFTRLSAFVADVPRLDPGLRAVVVTGVVQAPGRRVEQPLDVIVAPAAVFGKAAANRFVVKDDGSLEPPGLLNGYLWGVRNHANLRNPPAFEVKYPGPGRFVLRVTEVVGRGGNPVRIRVDGQPALEADLVCEEGRGEKWEVRQPGPGGNIAVWYNRDLAVDLTAGPHVIEVENLGRDRLAANYRFEGLATREKTPDVRVAGLRHRDGAHVWAQNMTWTPGTLIGETVGVPSRKVEIRLGGLRNGPVTVDRWDPMTGALVQSGRGQVVGGALTLAVAELCSDAAWKIRYR